MYYYTIGVLLRCRRCLGLSNNGIALPVSSDRAIFYL